MNARSSLLFAALMLGLAALTFNACSGSTNDGNNATSGGTSSGSSGSPNNPDCPATDPKEGDCSKPDLVCEYGDDFNPLCNVVRVCSGNRWSSPLVRSNKPQCPTTAPPTVKPNPAVCPAARSGIPAGSTCANPLDSGDIKCSYDGATCTCGNFCKSYPVQMPDCDTDGGQTENCCDRTKIAWYCFEGPAFCKSPRPRVGSPCTTEGSKCALTEPAECGQPTLECRSGTWILPDIGCPKSTARSKREIAYVEPDDVERLHDQVMSTRLATYRYKNPALDGDGRHLGFIIEDMPEGSPAVLPSRERVDLYGYASMMAASLQHQQREIDALKSEVATLRAENAAMKSR